MSVRVRFAPSPTGHQHIGGLRTALYNYLFARHHGGVLVLRVEDTDRTRYVEDALDDLHSSLQWAGIEFDEGPGIGGDKGPYTQSERTETYNAYAEKLIQAGIAYYAFDSAEELDSMRARQKDAGLVPKYDRTSMRNQFTLGEDETQRLLVEGAPKVTRLLVPQTEEIRFTDIVRGEVVFRGREVDDQILVKSDGFPTYHLANVVDDSLMEITHVIRAEEWLASTPKHVLMYDGLGLKRPQFAHLPLLLNPDKSKMSKRYGDVGVRDFRAKGYFPQALINFVALLGWNPSSDKEIFSMEELIAAFSLEKVNKAGAIFDYKKLDWMNGQYLKQMPLPELTTDLKPLLLEKGFTGYSDDYIARVIELLRERITFLRDIALFGDYFFVEPTEYNEEYVNKHWNKDTAGLVETLLPAFEQCEWTATAMEAAVKQFAETNGVALKNIIHPIRILVTGKPVGASMFETMEHIGRERCLIRLSKHHIIKPITSV